MRIPSDACVLNQLGDRFGTPLYVLSDARLLENYQSLAEAMGRHHSGCVIAYSYKTNYLGHVRHILHGAGAWAEVVSGIELQLALNAGVPGTSIVVNGPYKPRDELRAMLDCGALINLDSTAEALILADLARALGKTARVGLRLNSPFAPYPWTKFGASVGPEFDDMLEIVRQHKDALNLVGLHVHIGTNVSDPVHFQRSAAFLARKLLDVERRFGIRLELLDLGGGFPVDGAKPNDSAEWYCAPISAYVDALFKGLTAELGASVNDKVLIVEPGRFLVDDAFELLCSTAAIKSYGGNQLIILDGGVNLLPSAYYRNHLITALVDSGSDRVYDLYGPLCMQADLIASGWHGPELHLGDRVVISNAGAYSLSHAIQFIRPRAPVVAVGRYGDKLVQRRETVHDFSRRESND